MGLRPDIHVPGYGSHMLQEETRCAYPRSPACHQVGGMHRAAVISGWRDTFQAPKQEGGKVLVSTRRGPNLAGHTPRAPVSLQKTRPASGEPPRVRHGARDSEQEGDQANYRYLLHIVWTSLHLQNPPWTPSMLRESSLRHHKKSAKWSAANLVALLTFYTVTHLHKASWKLGRGCTVLR